jgi:DNA-directed RNA polymerase subunit beta
MAYTFTERKRIRKSFGKRDSVLKCLTCCRCSGCLHRLPAADVAPKKRTHEGLQAAFNPRSRSSRTTGSWR